ncbi:hypothetical protein LINGRAHAP2_LOCUS28097, partial [Linum grandiflorum]
NSNHTSTFVSFRVLLDRNWLVKVEYLYWEGNRTADYLASHGHSLYMGVHSIHVRDRSLSMHILYDLLVVSQS